MVKSADLAGKRLIEILNGRRIERALWEEDDIRNAFIKRIQETVRGVYRLRQDEAEAVACETLEAVWSASQRFQGSSTVGTYVFAILKHLARKLTSQTHRASEIQPEFLEANVDKRTNPASRTSVLELSEAVERGLARAHPGDSKAFRLILEEFLSLEEACKNLGISRNALHQRLHRAREAIRRALDL